MKEGTMNKITNDHLSRSAYVYVRQSGPGQLAHNPESRRRQYGLKDRAHAFGWENVIVIDDDLGRTASGPERLGFERLLTAVCTGIAGAVFAIEASRLARNGREWHTLLEFCGLVNCLIIDEDGVYDSRQVNDRLLLGMKGTFSELELSILRQRAHEARRLKATRGELYTCVAAGYLRSPDDRLEMDPDHRVQEALHLVFRKFAEFSSIRQVAVWLNDEAIEMPVALGNRVEWRLPNYGTVHRVLTNPVYAGAYVFGRTSSRIGMDAGRKVTRRSFRHRRSEWTIVIRDHHEGYISWETYERNLRIIGGNANRKGERVPGSVRNGGGLLVGLLRCGHCGRKLHVHHNGLRGCARYVCNDPKGYGLRRTCIGFGNMRIDAAVSAELLRVIAPLGLDAALQAIAECEHVDSELLRQRELALEQARFEAARACRQYDAVDPENRLVVSDLERRWNQRLAEVARLEDEIRIARDKQRPAITETERAEILALAADLPQLWNHPAASAATRKRILRAALEEIVVNVEPRRLLLKLHWKGGDHTALEVPKNGPGQTRWKTSLETEQLIRGLARLAPDTHITAILNRLGVHTGKGHTWTQQRVKSFRNEHEIPVYRDEERAERGEVTLNEAAGRLGVSKMTVVRLIKGGFLPAKQLCFGTPYVICEADLNRPEVLGAIKNTRAVSPDPRQKTFEYQ
jgi:excisionase family DNA binding protein